MNMSISSDLEKILGKQTTTGATNPVQQKDKSSPNSDSPSSNGESALDEESLFQGSYFTDYETEVQAGATPKETAARLNKVLEQRNAEQRSEKTIHGMTDREYLEWAEKMAERGLSTEQLYNYGNFQNVAVSMAIANVQGTRFNAQQKAADSANKAGVGGIILRTKLSDAINEHFGGKVPNWDVLLQSGSKGGWLYENKGICVIQDCDGTYSLSLVDKEGNIIEIDGKMAQLYENDFLMPDGIAQNNELNCAESLDGMGWDVASALDLSEEEMELVREMAKLDNSELGVSTNIKGTDKRSIRNERLGTYDEANKRWSKVQQQDNSAWASGNYVDKVTGQTWGHKDMMNDFNSKKKNGFYSGKGGHSGKGVVGGSGGSSGNGVRYGENGELILPEGVETDFNNNPITGDSVTQDIYDKFVTKLIYKGYTIDSAIKKANRDLDVRNIEYKGRFKDKLEDDKTIVS